MNLEQLRARLAAVMQSMRALVDVGEMNAEQSAQFDAYEKDAEKIKADIARLERLEASEREQSAISAGVGRRSAPAATTAAGSFSVRDNRADDPTGGFSSLAEFARAVCAAGNRTDAVVDERLRLLAALPSDYSREGGASNGDGYTVPPEQSSKIFELMFSDVDLLSMVDSEPTNSNSVQFLADETTPWGSTGIQAYWGAEAKQFTPSKLETQGRELKLHKLHAFAPVTEELLEDSPRLNTRLTSGAARAMNWKANEALLFGTGVGQPLGYFTAASKIEVAKESLQAAATINATNIGKMYSRNANPGRSIWLINQDILPQFIGMTIGNQPVYTAPNEGIKNAPGGMLMGRPVLFSDHCKTLGTVGDILNIDPMGYYLLKKAGGIKFASSIHLYFDYDLQAFRWTFRIGGQPYLSAPISPANGSNTRSHCVALATRA